MIVLIDNYDSFVHNLGRYFLELGQDVHVVRNDEISVDGVRALTPHAVVLSPGPCDPGTAGICVELVRQMSGEVPILGVCLGHQAIATAFGARVMPSGLPRHGVASVVCHDGRGVFEGLSEPLQAARYHSLVVDRTTLPDVLEVSAVSHDATGTRQSVETIMGIRHRNHLTIGVQFHPESVLTLSGHRLLANFLRLAGLAVPPAVLEEGVSEDTAASSAGRKVRADESTPTERGRRWVREVSCLSRVLSPRSELTGG